MKTFIQMILLVVLAVSFTPQTHAKGWGFGKAIKKVGKGIGKVGKGIGKGFGKVGKGIGKVGFGIGKAGFGLAKGVGKVGFGLAKGVGKVGFGLVKGVGKAGFGLVKGVGKVGLGVVGGVAAGLTACRAKIGIFRKICEQKHRSASNSAGIQSCMAQGYSFFTCRKWSRNDFVELDRQLALKDDALERQKASANAALTSRSMMLQQYQNAQGNTVQAAERVSRRAFNPMQAATANARSGGMQIRGNFNQRQFVPTARVRTLGGRGSRGAKKVFAAQGAAVSAGAYQQNLPQGSVAYTNPNIYKPQVKPVLIKGPKFIKKPFTKGYATIKHSPVKFQKPMYVKPGFVKAGPSKMLVKPAATNFVNAPVVKYKQPYIKQNTLIRGGSGTMYNQLRAPASVSPANTMYQYK